MKVFSIRFVYVLLISLNNASAQKSFVTASTTNESTSSSASSSFSSLTSASSPLETSSSSSSSSSSSPSSPSSSSSSILSTIAISSSSNIISTSTLWLSSSIKPTQQSEPKKDHDPPSPICLTDCVIQWSVISGIGAFCIAFLIWRILLCYCYKRKMQNTKSNAATRRNANLSNNNNVNFTGSIDSSSTIQRPASSYTRTSTMKYSSSPKRLSFHGNSGSYNSSIYLQQSRNPSVLRKSRNSAVSSPNNDNTSTFININSNESTANSFSSLSSHINNDELLKENSKNSGIESKSEFFHQSNFEDEVDQIHSQDNSQLGLLIENISKDDKYCNSSNNSSNGNINIDSDNYGMDLEQQKSHALRNSVHLIHILGLDDKDKNLP
ncbi:7729_t:CDS:1 [Ambispora gerdemannii]|uniref:7729_t:CDS:1 n=1 Tax=Ambispora gerdemannii TaxID=144530 RepID=A0A9N9BHB8_9GLOM|nr:7729_t:CDS:1 [Ambispora gerdemannii]